MRYNAENMRFGPGTNTVSAGLWCEQQQRGPPQYQILESGVYEQSFRWTRGPRGLIA